jgi:hypothetical protein
MIRPLLTAALCFSVGAANAATIDPLLAKSDVCGRFEVFHINGIMTTRTEAEQNLRQIGVVYGNAYKEHLIAYALAYNQTRGFATDFYDSALQVIKGYTGATWDSFMNAVTFGVYSTFMPEPTAKAIAKAVTDLFAFTKPSPYQDQDLADLMLDFQQSQTHARLVIVPHSQGNLYANLVYDKLVASGKPAKSIGVVGVAVPYSSVRSGNTYITSANDVVIDATRNATLGTVLGPNVTIPYQPTVDVLGHNLRGTYLANSTVRSMLNSRITSEFNGLKTTAPDPSRGIRVPAHGMQCGTLPYPYGPPPHSCYVDVPAGAPYQEHKSVSINFWNDPNIPEQQHTYGTAAELDPLNRTYMTTCYAWWIADRKAVIKSLGYVPTSGYYYPYHLHSGSCGAGFPWQTPYGLPDAAWTIYSADSSTTTSKSWTEGFDYYNNIEKWPLCKR